MPEGPVDGEGRGRAGERKAAGAAAGKAAEARHAHRKEGPARLVHFGFEVPEEPAAPARVAARPMRACCAVVACGMLHVACRAVYA
jgi:hypothetical protein